ncbi:MAG: AAA family ATPase [Burkholderiales bacterium]|nr:AAA family ATPase [Burkholderiales bacterium]
MITKIQEFKKQPALAELLLVLVANQNLHMSTIALLENGILSPAAGIARLKKQGVIIETIYQSIVDRSGRAHKRVACYKNSWRSCTMTPPNIASQGAAASRGNYRFKNENASGATEAFQLNQSDRTIARKVDLFNQTTREFRRLLLESANVSATGELAVPPTETPDNELMQEGYTEALIDLPEVPVGPIFRYKLVTDDDMHKLPAIQWRVKHVLPARGLAVMFGPSGSGKSFLVLDMLQSLAFGHDWFGHKVKQCAVTYIALEGEAGVAGRLSAYQARHGSTSPKIRYVAQPFELLDDDDIKELAAAILDVGASGVVVLDTLSRAIPGLDESDGKAMGLIIASAKKLQVLIGGILLLVHHTGKDASKGMRGHSSLHAALDCAIEVKRNGDHREWVIAKNKDGEDGASHPFKLEIVPLGIDSDGDAITSCVIVANQSAQAIAKKMPILGSNQTIALKALEEPLSKSVDIDKDGAPKGRPCLRFEQALAIVTPQMPGEAKHKKLRAKEVITSLVEKTILGMKGDWLWVN